LNITNQKGFSLANVMVAAGILGLMAVGMMKMNENSMKSAKTHETKFEIVNIVGEITGILSTPEACLESFEDMKADNNLVDEIKDHKGRVRFKKGQKVGSVTIESMRLSDSDSSVTVTANDTGDTMLEIVFARGKLVYGGESLLKKVKIWVDVDGGKKIKACQSMGSGAGSIWSRNDTDNSKIFYNDGNVGIGIDNPTEKLDVVGNTKITGNSEFVGDIKITGASEQVGNSTISGSLGLGVTSPAAKLDVAGGVKLGSHASCSLSVEGTMRYNETEKYVEFCNGTNWISTSGGKVRLKQYTIVIGSAKDQINTVNCPSTESVVSCGVDKVEDGYEDVVHCRLNLAANQCIFRKDRNNGHEDATGYCYCSF
jgi:Tfp pilus assembly major pilin PilA